MLLLLTLLVVGMLTSILNKGSKHESLIFALDYSPYRAGGPNVGELANSTFVTEDLHILSNVLCGQNRVIRTYGCGNNQKVIPIVGEASGFDVFQGAWLDFAPGDETEIVCACSSPARTVVVGNEVVLRHGSRAVPYLKSYADKARKTGKIVAIADTAESWIDNPDMFDFVDVVLVHSYPFWNPSGKYCTTSDWREAVDFVLSQIRQILTLAGPEKTVWLGESGWPSRGCIGCTPERQKSYVEALLNALKDSAGSFGKSFAGILGFEAFDELWKQEGEHCGGSSFAQAWGIFGADRNQGKGTWKSVSSVWRKFACEE